MAMADREPDGLTDRDRAQIEAARQAAGGCTFAAGCLTLGFAGLVTFGGIIMMHLMAREPGHVFGIAAIIALCWLAALGFFWLSKQ
jgi:hypothetical protein